MASAAPKATTDPSDMASRTTLARFLQAGVIPTSANAVICEVHRTWNRPDAAQLALFSPSGSPHPLLAELDRLDVNTLSPLEALNRLAAWKKQLAEGP